MTKLEEFKGWLKNCEHVLQGHTDDEIKNLAIAAGMDRQTVEAWYRSQVFAKGA